MKEFYTVMVARYCPDTNLSGQLWSHLQTAYSNEERHFHTLTHIEHLYNELSAVKTHIKDWDTLFFSMVYHDAGYDVTQYVLQADNEERSAAMAEKDLTLIGFPEKKIKRCIEQIMATKQHLLSKDDDTNYLTDADLCILGSTSKAYDDYRTKIRNEFIVYPDPIYKAGRIKILNQFIQMPRIFKTEYFYALYEKQARINITEELELLSI